MTKLVMKNLRSIRIALLLTPWVILVLRANKPAIKALRSSGSDDITPSAILRLHTDRTSREEL